MSLSVAKTIAIALVTSRLYYCNSLLHNIAIKDITKQQRVKKKLARVVTRSPRFSRSVSLLKSLHWLLVRHCIIFNICTITFHPSNLHIYIQCSLQQDSPERFCCRVLTIFLFPELRQTLELELSRLPHQPCGIHSLSVKLAGNIVSFRRHLKTFLTLPILLSFLARPSVDDFSHCT